MVPIRKRKAQGARPQRFQPNITSRWMVREEPMSAGEQFNYAIPRQLNTMKSVNFVDTQDYPIIVHCHLRWEGVWQRPQQFLSRISKRHKVLFVEGPILHDKEDSPTFELHPVKEYP